MNKIKGKGYTVTKTAREAHIENQETKDQPFLSKGDLDNMGKAMHGLYSKNDFVFRDKES